MKKGDVGMVKCFSKKYGNKGWAFIYLQSYVKIPVSAWCYITISLPQEQAAKTNMVSVVRIKVFSIMHSWGGCRIYLHMTDNAPMKLESTTLTGWKEMAYT